jgi:diacylglycerol O-acyltransferase-1
MVGLPMDDSSNNLAEKDKNEKSFDHILTGGKLGKATIERELRRRVDRLQQDLKTAQEDLLRFQNAVPETDNGTAEVAILPEIALSYSSDSNDNAPEIFLPPSKRGYLFRWVDRSIGWSGSKWALRFVTLENGNLAYYGSHTDTAPRYVLSLRGCAVRDEGHKPNKRYKPTEGDDTPPRLDKPGAYFFLFSIYLRDNASPAHQDPTADLTEITPLLRFSTDSYAEKKQWVQLISETCAYCESDAFLAEMERRQEEKQTMTLAMPEAKVGTLPPLYFAPVQQKQARHPSFTKRPTAAMFRTKSQNLDPSQVESKGYPPSKPMHRCAAPSYLSVEGPTQNYRGFFNLGVIVLVVSNIRLVLSSFKKHGFVLLRHLSEIPRLGDHPWQNFPFVSGFLLLFVFVMITYLLELGLSRRKIPQRLGMLLHYTNAHACMGVSVWIVWYLVDAPAIGAVLLLFATSTWMKLLSYVHTNEDYRSNHMKQQATFSTMVEDLDPQEARVRYPQNVTISNIFYFWAAPTLTYQIAFPRSPNVRLWKVAVILIRMVPILALFTFFVSQFVTPTLEGLVADLEANSGQYTFTMLAEYWLRLSIANTYLWLLMFYFYFHLFLNLFAELLRFGDRVFYKDWWNSSEVSAYWRLWNMPVHFWLVRHLYFPCVRMGMSKNLTTFIVFFVSAVLHEVLVSVPFHMVRPWSFLGMMMQIPLVGMTKVLSRRYPTLGNVIFWVSFCIVGQPMAVLLYTVDYQYAKHNVAAQECVA